MPPLFFFKFFAVYEDILEAVIACIILNVNVIKLKIVFITLTLIECQFNLRLSHLKTV